MGYEHKKRERLQAGKSAPHRPKGVNCESG